MFTGIIEEIGTVKDIQKNSVSARISISAERIMNDVRVGDSVAVNGVCLTATTVSDKGFTADVMAETLRRSSLGSLVRGSKVNLERAMLAGGRFGGHIVSGHIDGTGTVSDLSKEGNALEQDASKNMGDLAQDFKNKQNEMVGAKTDDSLVNADETFNIMKSEMEESNFMPLTKVDVSKVSQDLIMKINFLIKNANVNYNEFQVDIKRGIFMNTKENELYEVRKDPQTNQYKLYKGQQAVYTNNALDNNNVNTKDANNSNLSINDLAMFSDEELKTMGSNKSVTPEKRQAIMDELNKRKAEVKENTNTMTNTNVKKKTLVKDKITPILNNGYVSTILLTVGAAITGIIIAAILLMNK